MQNLRNVLLFFFCCIAVLQVSGQTTALTGRVTDEETNEEGIFTLEALKTAYEKVGKAPDERRIRNAVNQWRCRGYIVTMTNDSYKKTR